MMETPATKTTVTIKKVVPIKITIPHVDFIPKYKTSGSAGFDIKAYLPDNDRYGVETIIHPGETIMVPTGLKMAIPDGYELQIRSRSGIALEGIIVTNSPGTIDSDYRGEIKIILSNIRRPTDDVDARFSIKHGDRIAQGVLKRVPQASFDVVESLDATDRGDGGFGSTGKQ
jgi:dUTP pyrophosphatase